MATIGNLIGTAAGMGILSWLVWPGMSSHDTGLMVMAVACGLAAGVSAFLAIAMAMHFNRWTKSTFWLAMSSTLLYLFPPLGLSSVGWVAWVGVLFLTLASVAIVFFQRKGEALHSRHRLKMNTYRPLGENGFDEGINYSGYPTNKAIRMGIDD